MSPGLTEGLQGTDTFFASLSSLFLCLLTLAQKVFFALLEVWMWWALASAIVLWFVFLISGMSILEDQTCPYSYDTFKELILMNLSKRGKMFLGMLSSCSFIPSVTSLCSFRHLEIRPRSDPFAEVKFSLQSSSRSENMVCWICYLSLLLSHIFFSMQWWLFFL